MPFVGIAPPGMPPQGYGMPQPGYGMPQQGYGMPQQGYGMPQQGYGMQNLYGAAAMLPQVCREFSW
jgi:hypothetical protein